MTKQAADVFELQLVRTAENNVLLLASHPSCGERRGTMVPLFSKSALQGLLNLLETHLRTSIAAEGPEAEALHALGLLNDEQLPGEDTVLRTVGERLFAALFPPSAAQDEDIRGALGIALSQPRPHGQALRFQLRFDSHAVDLAALPWELMCDESGPLVASGRIRFSRYITFGRSTKQYPVADKLSVLVVAPRPRRVAQLDASLESQAIRRALDVLHQRGLLHVEVLEDPTFVGLMRAVNRYPYHILHFDGHGGYVVRCPACDRLQLASQSVCEHCGQSLASAQPQGCLVFVEEGASGAPHYLRAEELAVAVAESQVRLCVISACQSSTLKGASVFNSVAPKLIEAGIPAVIGMQFTVLDSHAARFVEELYRGLAEQKSVVAAADIARRLLYSERTWYIPTTYLRSKDGEGNLFRFQERAPGVHQGCFLVDAQGTGVYWQPAGLPLPDWSQTLVRDACPYKRLRPFVLQDKAIFFGRSAETASLLAAVIGADRRLAVLLGAAGVGKTSLLRAGLIPELLRHSYLILTVCGIGDPATKLRQMLAYSRQFDVDLSAVADLPALVDTLLLKLERPLLIACDDFDEYLAHTAPAEVDAFVEQVAQCVDRQYSLPVRFLFILREERQSQLRVFQERVPTIFDTPVFVYPLASQAAEQAITQPLAVCRLPVAYDAAFLHNRLLPDLVASPAEGEGDDRSGAVNPTYLQLVADDLLQAALQALSSLQRGMAFIIGEEVYHQRRTAMILNSYLDQKLSEHFPDAADLQHARSLLKQMITPDGDRRFQPRVQMVARAGVKAAQADVMLAMLEGDGLLEVRKASDGVVEYSIGHRFLAQQIRAWFDPQETLRQSAQDVLNQAWHIWRTRWQLAQQQQEAAGKAQALLISAEHLRDIRRTQEQALATERTQLTITPVHYCLLLRSAVCHRTDMGYWAQAIHNDAETMRVVAQIDSGVSASSGGEDVDLCRAALGLPPPSSVSNQLAHAAVAAADGGVRHTAALTLAALGVQAVADGLAPLSAAAPRRSFWRPTQALAQIRAGGFVLPELALTRQWAVMLWATFIAAWDNRWRILVEGAPAGLGAGAGLFLALALTGLVQADANSARLYLLLGLFALPLGFATGLFAVAGVWLCDLSGRTHSRLRCVAGFSLGFTASIVLVWMPVAVATALLSGRFAELAQSIVIRHGVGGFLWGFGIAAGALLAGAMFQRSLLWKTVMGGLGGATSCLLATLWGVDIPFLPMTGAQSPVWDRPYLDASLLGMWVGAGLIGGWLAGERIWRRFQQASVRAIG